MKFATLILHLGLFLCRLNEVCVNVCSNSISAKTVNDLKFHNYPKKFGIFYLLIDDMTVMITNNIIKNENTPSHSNVLHMLRSVTQSTSSLDCKLLSLFIMSVLKFPHLMAGPVLQISS